MLRIVLVPAVCPHLPGVPPTRPPPNLLRAHLLSQELLLQGAAGPLRPGPPTLHSIPLTDLCIQDRRPGATGTRRQEVRRAPSRQGPAPAGDHAPAPHPTRPTAAAVAHPATAPEPGPHDQEHDRARDTDRMAGQDHNKCPERWDPEGEKFITSRWTPWSPPSPCSLRGRSSTKQTYNP